MLRRVKLLFKIVLLLRNSLAIISYFVLIRHMDGYKTNVNLLRNK